MKDLAFRLLRRLPLLVVLFCVGFLTTRALRHTPWYQEKLYQELLSGGQDEQIQAAAQLAQLGAQERLLAALRASRTEARDYARRALEYLWFNAAGDSAYRMLAEAYQASEAERFDEALAILDRLLARHPKFAEAWNRRASVYWQKGQYEQSIADCERALALNPNHYGAWQGIGICRLQLGEVAEACRCLRTALKLVPHDEATRRSLLRCEELLRIYPRPDARAVSDQLI